MRAIPKNTDNYEYCLVNPNNHRNVEDCVIRAISKALNQSWKTTYKDLCEIGCRLGRMPNDRITFDRYLTSKGWKKCKEPRNLDNSKMTVAAFMRFVKDNIVIANVGSLHVTCIINKKVYDTWNCTEKTMHTYYVKEK